MKKIIATMMTGLFLITGVGLTAQPKGGGNGNGAHQQMRRYMENNIKPELMKQKKIWMDALTKSEMEALLKMKEEQEAIRESMKGKVTPDNRDGVRKAHFSAFKPRLDKIVNAHPDLKKQYEKEMTRKKEQWTKDIEGFGANRNNPNRGQGPMQILDKMTDPAFVLMWNPNQDYGKMAMRHQKMRKGMNQGNGMNPKQKQSMEPGIRIHPQPAAATVVVGITGVMNKEINAGIYDSDGKKVKDLYTGKATLPRLTNTLDVSGWKNGMYTVKVSFGERNMSMDFKVEK